MHEISVAIAIVDEVTERAAAEHAARIASVKLRVGELSCVVNEALGFAWELATDGTLAAGSQLEIERMPLMVFCPTCTEPRRPASVTLFVCSECGTPASEIVGGRELEVVSMEVVDVDSSRRSPTLHPEKELDAGGRPA